MVRVLMISVLAFGALVLVTQALPDPPPKEPLSEEESEPAVAEPTEAALEEPVAVEKRGAFSGWEGTWHGTFNIYNMNGTLVSTVSRRIERFPADIGLDITVSNIDGESATVVVHKHQSFEGDTATSREVDHEQRIHVLNGRITGSAIMWHHQDPSTGIQMIRREEVLPSGLYTVDGVGVIGEEVRFYEGRYTRSQ